MTLFAGALLRTIEFVMVATDASFPGPRGARARRQQELGSRADDAPRSGAPAGAGDGGSGAGNRVSGRPEPVCSGEDRGAGLGGGPHMQIGMGTP
jgi:hypothetical protein